MRVTLNSFSTDKPVALAFQIELEFGKFTNSQYKAKMTCDEFVFSGLSF